MEAVETNLCKNSFKMTSLPQVSKRQIIKKKKQKKITSGCNWRIGAPRARGWCIAVSFGCERLRNIITLTLDFYFLWIIPFSLPFAGAYFILQHNWGILILPTPPASLNYDLLLKWNMKIGEKAPGNVHTRVHCNQTAWQAVISQNRKQLKCISSLFACHVRAASVKIGEVGAVPLLTAEEFGEANMIIGAW